MSSLMGTSSGMMKSKAPAGYSQGSMSTQSPEMQDFYRQLVSGSSGGMQAGLQHLSQLAAGGSPEMWAQLEAPAMRQFSGLQGNLASRFSGMGSGSRKSSGFQNTMSDASTDLAERLQGQRMGLQNSAIQQLMGLSQQLLGTKTQENYIVPKKKPMWQEFLTSFAPGIGQGAGSFGADYARSKFGIGE